MSKTGAEKSTWRPFKEQEGKLRGIEVVEKSQKIEEKQSAPEVEVVEPPKIEKNPSKIIKEKPALKVEAEKKMTEEEYYEDLLREYVDGRVKVPEILNYLENFLERVREIERIRKETGREEPLGEEFPIEHVQANMNLLQNIREGKIGKEKRFELLEEEVKKRKKKYELTEEEMNKLLVALGFKEEYVKTMYEGKEVLEEMIDSEITSEQIAERAKEKGLAPEKAKEELKAEAVKKFLAERELVTRGIWAPKGEKWGVKRRTNLDGKSSLGLLGLAGIDISKAKFVAPGDWEKGAVNLDTGYRDGFVFQTDLAEGEKKDFLATTFFDHHGPRSDKNTSAAKEVYEILTKFKLLEKIPEKDKLALPKLVEFVTQVDNMNYPKMEKYFGSSDRTILGLQRFISFENLLKYIKTGHGFTEKLSDEDLKKYGFIYKDEGGRRVDRSKEQREIIESSDKVLDKLEKDGCVIATNYGKIVVDIGGELRGGQWATMERGYNGYLTYNNERGAEGFFLALNKGKLKDLGLRQGVLIRDIMYLQPRGKEPLRITLGDIIKKITPHGFRPKEKLEDFFKDEKEANDYKKSVDKREMEVRRQAPEKVLDYFKKALKNAPVWPPHKKVILEAKVAEIQEEEKDLGRKFEAWLKEWIPAPKGYPKKLREDLRKILIEKKKRKWEELEGKEKEVVREAIDTEKAGRVEKAVAEKREEWIKKYEEILAKHPIHGKASGEERRKLAEKLVASKLEELRKKILKR